MIPLVPYTHRVERYMIVHRHSNKLLTSDASSPTNQMRGIFAGAVNLNNRNGGSTQQWKFTQAGSNYTIQNYETGLNLDGNGMVNAAPGAL